MNFLAHQYLSFNDPEVMAGNFIADTVKGNQFEAYPEKIKKGILLHRFIDSFTDSHIHPLKSRERMYPSFGKYAAVVQDVFYDHFLARHWREFHLVELGDFVRHVYNTLGNRKEIFNIRAQRTFHYMEMQNWLEGYATEEGINRALTGLSNRASFKSNMDKSIPVLRDLRPELEADFFSFFPELIQASKSEFDRLGK